VESTADVVIIGAGVEGCSIGYALASSGTTSVTIIDRDTVGSGGTGRSAGIIRCHYGVAEIASLALASLEVFENATELLGEDIDFRQVGYVVGVGEDNLAAFRASLAAQRELGVTTDEISADEVSTMWPTAYLDDVAAFAFEPRGGYADAYATAQAFAGATLRHGGRLLQSRPVAAVDVSAGRVSGVTLRTGEHVAAGTVVVAAGAWSVPLLRPLGIDLPIQPQYVEEVLIDPGQDLGGSPVFSDLVSKQYAVPQGREVLCGDSSGDLRSIDDPDEYPNRADWAAIDRAVAKATHRFPGFASPAVVTSVTGMIDTTPDFNPIMSSTGIDGLYLAAGFSGHGYKIAPAVGRFVADLILHGTSSHPLVPAETFHLDRYAAGELLQSRFPYVGAAKIR